MFFFFRESSGDPPPISSNPVASVSPGRCDFEAAQDGHSTAAPVAPAVGQGNVSFLKLPSGSLGSVLFSSEESEKPDFQDVLGVLPFLGGKLLLVCQTKQMWPGDNIYFHNMKQIW